MPRRRAKRLPQRRPEEVALRALRAADRSRAELDARLERQGVDESERRETLDSLERLGYLDDARTAALRAQRLAERGYGDAYIRADLERRGLSAEAALADLEAETERASRFASRGTGWLARRGFASEGW
jgi:SOS response regulatory protein OraA/RecX